MTKDFDGIGINNMHESEIRQGISDDAWGRFEKKEPAPKKLDDYDKPY